MSELCQPTPEAAHDASDASSSDADYASSAHGVLDTTPFASSFVDPATEIPLNQVVLGIAHMRIDQIREGSLDPRADRTESKRSISEIEERIASQFGGIPSRDVLLSLYDDHQMSARGIARIVGERSATIGSLLDNYGSPRRAEEAVALPPVPELSEEELTAQRAKVTDIFNTRLEEAVIRRNGQKQKKLPEDLTAKTLERVEEMFSDLKPYMDQHQFWLKHGQVVNIMTSITQDTPIHTQRTRKTNTSILEKLHYIQALFDDIHPYVVLDTAYRVNQHTVSDISVVINDYRPRVYELLKALGIELRGNQSNSDSNS